MVFDGFRLPQEFDVSDWVLCTKVGFIVLYFIRYIHWLYPDVGLHPNPTPMCAQHRTPGENHQIWPGWEDLPQGTRSGPPPARDIQELGVGGAKFLFE